jgi:hypothetical protein
MIHIGRIALLPTKQVHRVWTPNPDGSLTWHKRANHAWRIERKNVAEPPQNNKPMRSRNGLPFRPWQQSVTLDDFIFLRDRYEYIHLPTGCRLTPRQINEFIFRDRAAWPARVGGKQVWPTVFIKRFNRVGRSAELNEAIGVLDDVAA